MRIVELLRTRLGRWVPRWWAGEGGKVGAVLSPLLLPAELTYRGAVWGRNAAYDRGWLHSRTAPIPVISVGNIGIGGAGKTPVSAWIAGRLLHWGHRPAILLRGYGRDEVLVHRELNPSVPVFADPSRLRAARDARRGGCDVVILDDGFQHRALARDLDVLLIAAESWAGAKRLLPRGPWREPPSSVRRAGLLVVTRKSAGADEGEALRHALEHLVPGAAVVQVHLAPKDLLPLHGGPTRELTELDGQRVLLVAALASPRSLVHHVEAQGAEVELAEFPDHHEFTAEEAAALRRRAARRPIILTLKDAVKLRSWWGDEVNAMVLRQRTVIERGGDVLDTALRGAVSKDPE